LAVRVATTRGLERLVFFTDAIAAIAITLLILPLVDLVPEIAAHTGTLGDLFEEGAGQMVGFAISFAVIARLWFAHHQLFEHVEAYTPRLVLLTIAWAFTIVLLPLPTAITAQLNPTPGTIAFYIGTMTASSLILTGMTLMIRNNPRVESRDNPISPRNVVGSVSNATAFVVAFALGTAVPAIGYWALFVLFLSQPIEALVGRSLARR
jgi:uncharacterized membrane protein